MIRRTGLVLGLALLSTTALAAGTVSPNAVNHPGVAGSAYQIHPQISNQPGQAPRLDRGLVDAWGIGQIPGGPIVVNANGINRARGFNPQSFQKQSIKIRTADEPTGIDNVPANPNGDDFVITEGANSGPSQFIIVDQGGQVQGWNPSVDAGHAITAIDRSGAGSSFTGVSFLAERRLILVSDFAAGFVEMFDGGFNEVGHFTDNSLPANYEPFNVRVLRGKVYVMFAERDPATGDEVHGAGLGAVDVFDHQGNLVKQLVAPGGALNAPWGIDMAPPGFGQFAGDLLIGNFGDGKINVYDPATGNQLGTLSDAGGNPLAIDGLWGIKSGPGAQITFAAGPNDEQDGLIGTVSVAPQ
jgi:uncharacterized protein (TIGR03118 family)